MEELIFFFNGILGLFAMAIWTGIGMMCGIWIDIIISRILGIDHSRHIRYPSYWIKTIMTLGMYGWIIYGIKGERGEN